jgi:predicted nucleic acid-binding protein
MKKVIMDAGFLIDLFRAHEKSRENAEAIMDLLRLEGATLHTLWECIAEASHKLNNQGRQALLGWMHKSKNVEIHASTVSDFPEMAAYMQKYANASKGDGPDITDVALVFLAEKLKAAAVLTVDVNDFQTYRTRKGKPLTIVSWH